MAWECSAATMQRLISLLKANGIIKSDRVEQAMLKVDRSHYCPSKSPYMDAPYSIGYGATISAPHMHAHALEALQEKLVDGARVLDIGSGSGYLTACMAHMVGPSGKVYGVEHISQLVKQSEVNLRNDCPELIDSGRLQIFQADGRIGLERFAPYDAIHVGAGADDLPEKLIEQMNVGGRMVVPIQSDDCQVFESIDKLPEGKISRKELLRVRYIPLTDVHTQLSER